MLLTSSLTVLMPPRYSLLHPLTLHHISRCCAVGASVCRPEAMDLTVHRNEGQEIAAPWHGSDSVSVFVAPGRTHHCALRCRPTILTAAAPPTQLKISQLNLSHSASI
ncbi:hypothetical protein C8R45DRAFT_1013412 [Mycena sanguinolenta]|nr:hypothetical protein C8R45DRAFT_1013412 [Mycena sanguinolenta]